MSKLLTSEQIRASFGSTMIDVPRDVMEEFEPVIVKKHERSIGSKLEEAIISRFSDTNQRSPTPQETSTRQRTANE